MISALLENDLVPVFCSLTHDGAGQLLNTNADTLSSLLALLSQRLRSKSPFLFRKKGVLKDPQDENSVIHEMSREFYQTLLEQKIISNGMIPKLDNAFAALGKGVKKISIGDAGELLNAIHKKENAGTSLIGIEISREMLAMDAIALLKTLIAIPSFQAKKKRDSGCAAGFPGRAWNKNFPERK